jgi:uncharacterized protein (DUF1778 family)
MYCRWIYTHLATLTAAASNMANSSTSLMVRLDPDSKDRITRAAQLRRISVSDYVRSVVVAQARREIEAAANQVITLTPDEQLAFWQARTRP